MFFSLFGDELKNHVLIAEARRPDLTYSSVEFCRGEMPASASAASAQRQIAPVKFDSFIERD